MNNKNKIIRIGIVGAGFAAKFHFDALQRVHSVKLEIAGAYAIDSVMLDEFTSAREIKRLRLGCYGFGRRGSRPEWCDGANSSAG